MGDKMCVFEPSFKNSVIKETGYVGLPILAYIVVFACWHSNCSRNTGLLST